jgi:hypothetical protein
MERLEEKIQVMMTTYWKDKYVLDAINYVQREIKTYKNYSGYYGYVFYVLQK